MNNKKNKHKSGMQHNQALAKTAKTRICKCWLRKNARSTKRSSDGGSSHGLDAKLCSDNRENSPLTREGV